jgi:hypothetical protein
MNETPRADALWYETYRVHHPDRPDCYQVVCPQCAGDDIGVPRKDVWHHTCERCGKEFFAVSVREGQFIYSRLKAFEGAFGAVSSEYSGCHVSNEFPTFELDESRITLSFLVAYTLSPQVWKSLAVHSKGVGARRERLKPENFLAEEIWLTPMDWQRKIKSTTAKLAAAKADRESVGLEFDALLPAILDRAFKGEL